MTTGHDVDPPEVWKGTFGERLGLRYVQIAGGRARAAWSVGPEHCNPSGVCHGGALVGVADDTMGAAAHTVSPPGMLPAAAQINTHFARSARAGDELEVETRVASQGRRTAVLESRVSDGEGRLVSLLTASSHFVEARHVPPEA